MRTTLLLAVALATSAAAADRSTLFQVEGMECASCVYLVQQALTEAKGVKQVAVDQGFLGGTAKVQYDAAKITEHQIAQTVREAVQLHGKPYLATLEIQVPGYASQVNAAKIQSWFTEWKSLLDLVVVDEAKGRLLIRFKPLEEQADGSFPPGWSLEKLTSRLDALKLAWEIIEPRPL